MAFWSSVGSFDLMKNSSTSPQNLSRFIITASEDSIILIVFRSTSLVSLWIDLAVANVLCHNRLCIVLSVFPPSRYPSAWRWFQTIVSDCQFSLPPTDQGGGSRNQNSLGGMGTRHLFTPLDRALEVQITVLLCVPSKRADKCSRVTG